MPCCSGQPPQAESCCPTPPTRENYALMKFFKSIQLYIGSILADQQPIRSRSTADLQAISSLNVFWCVFTCFIVYSKYAEKFCHADIFWYECRFFLGGSRLADNTQTLPHLSVCSILTCTVYRQISDALRLWKVFFRLFCSQIGANFWNQGQA